LINQKSNHIDTKTFIQSIRKLASNSYINFPPIVVQQTLNMCVSTDNIKEALADQQNTIIEFLEPSSNTGYERVVVSGRISDGRSMEVSVICSCQPYMLIVMKIVV